MHVRLAGSYDFDRFERMVEAVQPLLWMQEPAAVHLDLGGLVFIGPTSLALLEAVINDLARKSFLAVGGQLILPRNEMTRNYLHRMDFFSGLDALEPIDEPFSRRPAVGFQPCMRFRTVDELPPVTSGLSQALVDRCKVDEVAKAAMWICLDELVENVIHHAASPVGGVAAAQGVLKKNRFEVGIADLGVGIRGSLAKNPKHADIEDDVQAIVRAMEPFVTATPRRNAGTGLFITKLLLKRNGGELLIRSGRGLVRGAGQEIAVTVDTHLPGTVVALRARTDQALDINSVYEQLAVYEADHDVGSGESDD